MTTNIYQRDVLLLNVTYEPLGVITIKKAVGLMLRGVAHGVSEGVAANLRTVSGTFSVPNILRIKHYVRAPKLKARLSKKAILRRDGYQCCYCGVQIGDKRDGKLMNKSDFTVEHVVPVSRGGKTSWNNCVCACWRCNNTKGNKYPHEIGFKMLFEPKTPRTNYVVMSGSVPEEWKLYIDIGED